MGRTIYILIIAVISLNSCKNDLDQPRRMKGKMMYNCITPATNAEFFVTSLPTYMGVENFREDFKTDSLGYFDVVFYANSYNPIRIGPKSGGKILENIPLPKANETFDVGNVYISFSYKTVVKLVVTKPYTENDTLYYGSNKQLAGPFHNMILDTLKHIDFGAYYDEQGDYTTQAGFTIISNGEILLRGTENGNGIIYVPKISDVCENGTMGEEIYYIR